MFSANVEEVEVYLVAKLPELHVPPPKKRIWSHFDQQVRRKPKKIDYYYFSARVNSARTRTHPTPFNADNKKRK
jgi:hypothetical protein